MPSSDRPGGYGGGPEGSAPRDPSDESWFEVLNAPLPSETHRDEPTRAVDAGASDRGSMIGPRRMRRTPSDDAHRRTEPQTEVARTRVRKPGAARRVRRTIRHIDPLSVLKVSLIVYAVMLIVWLLFVAIFYSFLDGLGLFDTINSALKGFAYDEVNVTLGVVEKWAFIAGLVVMIGGAILNVFLAIIYNIISRTLGGIEVTFVERES